MCPSCQREARLPTSRTPATGPIPARNRHSFLSRDRGKRLADDSPAMLAAPERQRYVQYFLCFSPILSLAFVFFLFFLSSFSFFLGILVFCFPYLLPSPTTVYVTAQLNGRNGWPARVVTSIISPLSGSPVNSRSRGPRVVVRWRAFNQSTPRYIYIHTYITTFYHVFVHARQRKRRAFRSL